MEELEYIYTLKITQYMKRKSPFVYHTENKIYSGNKNNSTCKIHKHLVCKHKVMYSILGPKNEDKKEFLHNS